MIEGTLVCLITDLVHLGVRLPNGVLLKSESCNLDDANLLSQMAADPDGEVVAGLVGRGYRLCQRCFPEV